MKLRRLTWILLILVASWHVSSAYEHTLVLIRHGESVFNKENRFCGWCDTPLTTKGIEQAMKAGELLKQNGTLFDVAFTSVLRRAIKTLNTMLSEMELDYIPVHKSWRLNERMYGILEGMTKSEANKHYGMENVHKWRREFQSEPPSLAYASTNWAGHDRRYKLVPSHLLPVTESLQSAQSRVLPYWYEAIFPEIQAGQKVLVVAHANIIRALIKAICEISDEDITKVNIPNATPMVLEFDQDMNPLHRYCTSENWIKHD